MQGAMNNFDHEENSKSGIEGSDNIIQDNDETSVNGISAKPESRNEKKAFSQMLDCQKLIYAQENW